MFMLFFSSITQMYAAKHFFPIYFFVALLDFIRTSFGMGFFLIYLMLIQLALPDCMSLDVQVFFFNQFLWCVFFGVEI